MFVNLTPHQIEIRAGFGGECRIVVPPTKPAARVSSTSAPLPVVEGVPVVTSPQWGEVEGLPAPETGVRYIVSAIVLARCAGRKDVFAPATGPGDGAIRDEKGQIVAVTKLVAAPE